VEIPKEMVMEFLRDRANPEQADQAERELPDQVDPERDSSLLERFGVDKEDLLRVVGGRLPGGIGDKLGL
jgi:hypothetical protein